MHKRMISEANAINEGLARARVWAGVQVGNARSFYETPAFTAYRLIMPLPDQIPPDMKGVRPATVATVTQALPDIEGALCRARGDNRLSVRFDHRAGMIEVPNPSVIPIHVTDKILAGLNPGEAVIGNSFSMGKQFPVRWYLDTQHAHLLIAGQSGSGKTEAVKTILATLTYATSPDNLRLVLIDRKRTGLQRFANLPHTMAFTSSADDAPKLIEWIRQETERRVQDGWEGQPHIILVIDELAELGFSGDKDIFETTLASAITRGRELGVHIFGSAQNPSKGLLTGTVRQQFSTKIIGRVEDADVAYDLIGRKRTGAETLPGKGSMLFLQGGEQPIRIQVRLVDDTLIGRAIERWKDSPAPKIELVEVAKPTGKPKKERTRKVEEDAPLCWDLYDEWVEVGVNQAPKIKYGGKAEFIRRLDSSYTGGDMPKYIDSLVAYMSENVHKRGDL